MGLAPHLPLIWFGLLGVLLTGYAVLDGFDLGVGALHLFARGDEERRVVLNSIGPLWDGNEVWLVTFGGALFAAFPQAYAAAFSAFYLPFMVLLVALIFRAVSIEFRSKRPSPIWRGAWDGAFAAASVLLTFLMGTAVGTSIHGLPLRDGELEGGVLDLLQPYALLVGVFAVATATLHGAVYLHLKTEGALQARVARWRWRAFWVFLALYLATTAATAIFEPQAAAHLREHPAGWVIVILNVLAVANIPRALHFGRGAAAFVSSSCTVAALVFLFGAAMFPNLVRSTLGPAESLDVVRAASSEKTLRLMLLFAFLGLPLVAAYTAIVHWVFRGKVKLGTSSY